MRLLGAISVCMACIASGSVADGHHDAQIPLSLSGETQLPQKVTFSIPEAITLRNLEIDFDDREPAARSNALLQYLASPESPKDIVQEITVTGYPSLGNWTLLAEVIDQLISLQDIHWDAEKAISKEILTPIEAKNPLPRLHYTLSFRNWDPYDDKIPGAGPVGEEHDHDNRTAAREAIISSKALHSLVAKIEYGGSPNRQDMDLVFRILANSPNLKELDLSVGHSGCVVSDGQPRSFDFQSNPDVRFPALEVLTLEGYDFDADSGGNGEWDFIPYPSWEGKMAWRGGWPWKWLPQIIMDGVHEVWNVFDFAKRDVGVFVKQRERGQKSDGKTNLDHWLMIMDWSQLHTLNLKWVTHQFLIRLCSVTLPSLRNVIFTSPDSGETVLDFITNSTVSLESIALQSMGLQSIKEAVDTIATHHGPSLKHLAIHERETWSTRSAATPTIETALLSNLLTSCTKLQKLEFDLPRPPPANESNIDELQMEATNMTHHQLPIYKLLATAPELQHLVLHYQSPDLSIVEDPDTWYKEIFGYYDERDDIPDPFINKNSTLDLFSYLRSAKVGKELDHLEVFVGDWENRHQPRQMMGRPEKRIARYVCQVDGGGKEACKGRQSRNDD